MRSVAGGWTLTAITSLRSGTPLTITACSDNNFEGTNNDRADLIGNPFLDPNASRSQVVRGGSTPRHSAGMPRRPTASTVRPGVVLSTVPG